MPTGDPPGGQSASSAATSSRATTACDQLAWLREAAQPPGPAPLWSAWSRQHPRADFWGADPAPALTDPSLNILPGRADRRGPRNPAKCGQRDSWPLLPGLCPHPTPRPTPHTTRALGAGTVEGLARRGPRAGRPEGRGARAGVLEAHGQPQLGCICSHQHADGPGGGCRVSASHPGSRGRGRVLG